MTDINREHIEQFWENIAPWKAAYTNSELSFLAVRREKYLNLIQGRVFLRTAPATLQSRHFQTNNVVAGCFSLSELGLDCPTLVGKVMAAEPISTPLGELILPIAEGEPVSSYFMPFHSDGIGTGTRIAVLTLSGARWRLYLHQPEIDWELKAASEPFDSINELLGEYGLGGYRNDLSNIEVIAYAVAEVDFNSKVKGKLAKPGIFLANALSPEMCKIGYRVLLHGQVIERGSISGENMKWKRRDNFQHGVGKVKIPAGAVLQCFAIYRGYAHHQGWIADLSLAQNSRRVSFEEFDDKLIVLRDFLFEENKPRKDARDFEVGVAWLLWMIGFSVAHAGATPRTADATDILATTPNGHMALVECTTGHLKADSKLSKLVERAQTVRRRLDASGNRHIRLLPVIVTSLGRDEVKADLEQAQDLGVSVVAREDLNQAITQSITTRNADLIFEQAEKALLNRREQLDLRLPNP